MNNYVGSLSMQGGMMGYGARSARPPNYGDVSMTYNDPNAQSAVEIRSRNQLNAILESQD